MAKHLRYKQECLQRRPDILSSGPSTLNSTPKTFISPDLKIVTEKPEETPAAQRRTRKPKDGDQTAEGDDAEKKEYFARFNTVDPRTLLFFPLVSVNSLRDTGVLEKVERMSIAAVRTSENTQLKELKANYESLSVRIGYPHHPGRNRRGWARERGKPRKTSEKMAFDLQFSKVLDFALQPSQPPLWVQGIIEQVMKTGRQFVRDVKVALRATRANDVRRVRKYARQEIPSTDLHKFEKRLAKINGKRRCTLKVGVKGFRTQVGRVIWHFAQRLGTTRPTRIHSVPQRGKRLRDYLLNRAEAFTKVADSPPQPLPENPPVSEDVRQLAKEDTSFGDTFCELADPKPTEECNPDPWETKQEQEVPRARTPAMFAQIWGVDGRKSVCTCRWLGIGGSLIGSPLEDMRFQLIDGHVHLTTCMPGNYQRLFNMREVEKVRAPLSELGRMVPKLPSLKDMCCPTSQE